MNIKSELKNIAIRSKNYGVFGLAILAPLFTDPKIVDTIGITCVGTAVGAMLELISTEVGAAGIAVGFTVAILGLANKDSSLMALGIGMIFGSGGAAILQYNKMSNNAL